MSNIALTTHLITNPARQSPKLLGIAPKHLQPMATLEDLDIPVGEPWNFPPVDRNWKPEALDKGIAYTIHLRKREKTTALYLAALDLLRREVPNDAGFVNNYITLVYIPEDDNALYGLTVAPIIPLLPREATYRQWQGPTTLHFADCRIEPYSTIQRNVLMSLATQLSSSPPKEPELVTSGSSGNQIHMLRVLLG